jgi:acyl-CoA synthetase (NDP forming)
MTDLHPFYRPGSIAVVGAGDRPTSTGGAVLQMLQHGGYKGRLFPVNPKGGTGFGLEFVRSLADLPAPADLCIIVIRPEAILDAVREAAATGHRHILILPGGFAEAGDAGRQRDAELRQLIRQHDLRVAGPNCAGIIRHARGGTMAATFLRSIPPGGNVALLSQSGAVAEEMIAAANRMALPIGTVVSVGNAVQIGVTDHMDYLAGQDECEAVLVYAESIEDPVRFRATARRLAAIKPVVMLVGGRTRIGAAAARAHTGAVPNDDAAMDAFTRECGILRVHSLRSLMLAAKGFGFFPNGLGRRFLVMSNAGGPGVLAADRAVLEGADLPALPAGMARALARALPPESSIANPLDLLADAREDRFGAVLEQLGRHGVDAFDALLGIHVVPFMVDPVPVVQRIAEMVATMPIPMLHTMMGTLPERAEMQARLEAAGIPHFVDIEEMALCASLLTRYPALREIARGPAPETQPCIRGREDAEQVFDSVAPEATTA